MRAVLALSLLLATSCSSSPEPPAAHHAAPATAAPAERAGVPFFGKRAEVPAYLRQAMPRCPEHLTLQVSDGVDEAFADRACAIVNEFTGAWCYRYGRRSHELNLDIRYMDHALMLGVHEGRVPASRLSPEQARAYALARSVVAQAKAAHSSDYDVALALHDWIVLHSRYNGSLVTNDQVCGIMLRGEGLCEAYAGTYCLLARMAGLECRYITGKSRGVGHAWNLLRLGGQWVHVDCTYDDPTPDKKGKALRHYFGMSDATMALSHQWERAQYPACTSEQLWYPAIHLPRFATLNDMAAALVDQAQRGGARSLDGYVEELARQPQRAEALLRAAVNRQRRSLGMEQGGDRSTAGYITLILR